MDVVNASTTSPTAVPLPTSPNATQSDFEALINLLGTDEADEHDPDRSSKTPEVDQPIHWHNLRDEDGRLDFIKMKAIFSSNGHGSSVPLSQTDKGSIDQAEHDQPETETEAATVVLGSPARTSGGQSLMEPSQLPAETVDSLDFESGLPPVVAESTPKLVAHLFRGNDLQEDLIDLSSDQPPLASDSDHDEVSPLAIPSSSHAMQSSPLSQEAPAFLPASLALAHQEVAGLRKRVQELEGLIKKSRDPLRPVYPQWDHRSELQGGETLSSFQAISPAEDSDQILPAESSSVQRDEVEGRLSRMTNGVSQARELNALSLTQTRIALQSLLEDLALPFSCIPGLLKEDRKSRPAPTSSLEEIRRAVDMVTFVDELVWRRSRMGAIYDNPYSEENVQALRDRLELWEKTVRTPR